MQSLSDGWIPEDIYCFLLSGQASLYISEEGWKGFAILQLLPNYAHKRLHVWVVQTTDDPAIYMAEIEKIARDSGAVKITFDSPRRGWTKRAERLGFNPTSTRYEKEL